MSRAGTVSRVHVSWRSGGWRINGPACSEPKRTGREERGGGEEDEDEGRGRRKDCGEVKASRGGEGVGWLRLHVRRSLSSCEKKTVCKTRGMAAGSCIQG